MVEFNPRSLFGKHPYALEQFWLHQAGLVSAGARVAETIAFVEPVTIGLPLPLQKLPVEWRKKWIRKNLTKAKHILTELGV